MSDASEVDHAAPAESTPHSNARAILADKLNKVVAMTVQLRKRESLKMRAAKQAAEQAAANKKSSGAKKAPGVATVEIKKKRKLREPIRMYRACKVAMHETGPCVQRAPLRRAIREIAQDYSSSGDPLRFAPEAMEILCEQAECYMREHLSSLSVVASIAGRVGIKPIDALNLLALKETNAPTGNVVMNAVGIQKLRDHRDRIKSVITTEV